MRMAEALATARAFLRQRGVPGAALEAELLLARAAGTDRVGVYREAQRVLLPAEEEKLWELLRRRADGEPVAYLLGEKEFMGLSFAVTPDVLIPRPETELLVETALLLLEGEREPLVAEAGTGSGCIAVSLARYHPGAVVYATDISPPALEVAAQNARRHGVEGRVRFLAGDLLTPLYTLGLSGRLSLVAANLPYVPRGEIPQLPVEVSRYEPLVALDGGEDGLDLYRRLVPQAWEFLRPGGYLLVEISPPQAGSVPALFAGAAWQLSIKTDLAGRERLVVARKG
ncbi:peptide chain release factor N(5)-glutamine methyltransferase [Desulfovirgula thermocuniculi]|uniref:peptide chain release factor N(5)-glutamine methyltransferase n=1 Tax=Desulfovirgula thermocuniculi TaxID=348842 RepID=UPI0004237F94|nr:peptide chain release factor N(5)-glutamine methyltransferase [Desulfovirgula thermocuniculi]